MAQLKALELRCESRPEWMICKNIKWWEKVIDKWLEYEESCDEEKGYIPLVDIREGDSDYWIED